MITPVDGATVPNASPSMTADRWRAVDAVLKLALACEPAERDAFVAQACGDDEALRREVESLLTVYDTTNDDFLERPAAEALATPEATVPLRERLETALAGRYAIERELAHGGMSTVYLAHDLKHDRRVAIKVLREELAAAVGAERFLEEIRVTASLQHPHILPLFDSGAVPARQPESEPRAERRSDVGPSVLFYVMPFVEGETLRSRLARERQLPADVAIRIAREMADALEHAHRHGVVHRDVKPENVLLQGDHALVADFGIALALEHAGGDRLTRTGITIGTPQYMAPEQAAGERAIDARADVYALGAVLHEMLTGESPLTAVAQAAVPWRTGEKPPAALAAPRPGVAPLLDAAVRQALAKRPEERFQSAAEFAAGITAPSDGAHHQSGSLGEPAPSEPLPERRDPAPAGSRGRMVSARAAAYVAIAMLIVGLAGGWLLAHSPLAERWTSSAPDRINPATRAADPVPAAREDNLVLTVVDRSGRPQRAIPASRPWTPRFSPDGQRVAYGAFGDGRSTSDLWVMDLRSGTTRRLTDDDADSNDPQWSADGSSLAYSVSAPGGKDLMVQRVSGGGAARLLARRPGTQFPSDWLRDGGALLVTDEAGRNGHDIIVQPADGSPAWPYSATSADETAARISPDGRWVAYTSDESGRTEVYLDSYPKPGARVAISLGGGMHPVWRGDGRELYYWNDGALTAVQLGKPAAAAMPAVGSRTVLFRTSYQVGPNTMYDVSPDGQQFVIVRNAAR